MLFAAVAALIMTATPAAPGFVSVRDGKFIDGEGRHLLLHGMSVIEKSRGANYRNWQKAEDIAALRDWGMNCIRLGIIWDAIEPQPGAFNEDYLKHIDEVIVWAKAAGVYVFLDMHQDLYSYKYSDGAPDWATLTDGLEHIAGGGVWSDAYLTSPAIQRAFDNFWTNKPCADGVGVQDHFAQAWRHVAERYKDNPTVIAYDLFNEPNIGSGNAEAQVAMAGAMAKLLPRAPGAPEPSVEEVIQQWLDVEGRHRLMQVMEKPELYKQLVDAAGPVYSTFERTRMVPMFQRVRDAIRTVDTRHLIFLETSMSANMGIPTGVGPVLDKDGKPDPLQAYAPHGYDIVVDTPDLVNANNGRVDLIFQRHGETAKRLGLPMLIGEWGAFGGSDARILPTAWHHAALFESLLCSDTFWAYGKGMEKDVYFPTLNRPIPQSIAGTLRSYHYDPAANSFACAWTEDTQAAAPTVIYVPGRVCPDKDAVRIEPASPGCVVEPVAPGSKNFRVVIPALGRKTARTLTVQGNR